MRQALMFLPDVNDSVFNDDDVEVTLYDVEVTLYDVSDADEDMWVC